MIGWCGAGLWPGNHGVDPGPCPTSRCGSRPTCIILRTWWDLNRCLLGLGQMPFSRRFAIIPHSSGDDSFSSRAGIKLQATEPLCLTDTDLRDVTLHVTKGWHRSKLRQHRLWGILQLHRHSAIFFSSFLGTCHGWSCMSFCMLPENGACNFTLLLEGIGTPSV